MMMPWPTYAGDGLRAQSHLSARCSPKIGILRAWGTK
jgi:hypothetical protein